MIKPAFSVTVFMVGLMCSGKTGQPAKMGPTRMRAAVESGYTNADERQVSDKFKAAVAREARRQGKE